MSRSRVVVLAVLAMVAGSVSCSDGTDRSPSILLISIDTLRRDHVSAYGYPRPTTPALDALAVEGARFDDGWSPTSWTLPAHMSALTGLPPSTHGVEGQNDRLPDGLPTLTERLRDAGWTTGGFVSHVYLDAKYGFDRGFDTYVTRPLQSAEDVTGQALRWLDERGDGEPFFLFLHYFDPHADYEPPATHAGLFDEAADLSVGRYTFLRGFEDPAVPLPEDVERAIVALYDAEIRYTDDHVARVLDALRRRGRLDDTVVAVFSDHGEEFKEHGSMGHGGTLYAEVTRVPLIVRFPPRVPAGMRVLSPVSLSDLPALLASLAGVPDAETWVGGDPERIAVLAELAGEAPPAADRSLVLETTREGPKRFALVEGGFTYVGASSHVRLQSETDADGRRVGIRQQRIPIPEGLFRKRDDPFQQRNLLAPGSSSDDPSAEEVEGAVIRARRAVAAYARERARGVRLVCAASAPTRFEGTLRFDRPVLDEPFGVGFTGGDRIATLRSSSARLTSDLYAVELEPGDGERAVVVVPAPESSAVHVSLLRDGASYFDGRIAIPPPGHVEDLGTAGDVAGCRLEGGLDAGADGRGEVALTEEELERLRSLGYVP